MSREKKTTFLAACGGLGLDNVGQPSDRNFDAFDAKDAPFVPDFLEIESCHRQRQVYLPTCLVGCSHECSTRDDRVRDNPIAGHIERLISRPE